MKKILTTITAVVLVVFASNSPAASGDGGVFLKNDHLTVGTGEIHLNGVATSANVFVQVLAAAWDGSSPLLSSLSPSFSPLVQIGTANSTFSANTTAGFEGTFNNGTGKASVGAGGNAQFQIIAWITTASETFATASIKGQSAVWGQATGVAPSVGPPPTTGSPVTLNIPSANIALVPEPSVIALGVLGGLGLLLRRRK